MPDIKTAWNKIAPLYHRKYLIRTNTVHYGPLCPGEDKLGLLGNIAGKKAIDLGCGAGQNAIALAKEHADAAAVDFSANQLTEAMELAQRENVSVEFINSNIIDMPCIKDDTFNVAISACAMAFVNNISAAFSEVFRILKPGGKFILSVMHPAQYILDGVEGSMYFNSSYPFNPRLLKWSWDLDGKKIKFQHYLRSIADYHNNLNKAGFMVKKILEPKPTLKTPHIAFSKEIMKEYPYIAKHLPITLIFSSVKPEYHKKRGSL
ncbi:MAG: methyltransferase domain-containing protein [candidate division Zixibacteria bacterium]|nr:methyltransferase domain-containing protein [candidate division Zixibacteria bacterium]